MAAISDSSPLILFGTAQRLDLLRRVFSRIIIPTGVRDEVLASGAMLPGAESVARATWITNQSVADTTEAGDPLAQLGRGEREAILLARQRGGRLAVLLDDRGARRVAEQLGLQVYGSAGVLVLAKEVGAISAVRPELDRLLGAGLYLSESVYRRALTAAGETPGEPPEPIEG